MAASSAAALALEHFAEHGYVVVEDAIDQATVAELNRIVDLRLQHEQGAAEAISSSRGYAKYEFSDGQHFCLPPCSRPSSGFPAVTQTVHHPRTASTQSP